MRLMGSTLMELNEKRQASKAVFSHQSYEETMKSDVPAELKRVPICQINMATALMISWTKGIYTQILT